MHQVMSDTENVLLHIHHLILSAIDRLLATGNRLSLRLEVLRPLIVSRIPGSLTTPRLTLGNCRLYKLMQIVSICPIGPSKCALKYPCVPSGSEMCPTWPYLVCSSTLL